MSEKVNIKICKI